MADRGQEIEDDPTHPAALRARAAARARLINRISVVLLLAAAVGAIWWTNVWLTDRFSENTRVRAELRSALYTGNLLSELQRTVA